LCTAARENVVSVGSSLPHQLLPDPDWEVEVGQAVTVEVAQLPLAEPKLDAAEPVRRFLDSRPTEHFAADLLARAHG
jgi:hypothetical protein